MSQKFAMVGVFCVIFFISLINIQKAEGRYLPTRSNSDRIDKLRELLKEVSKVYKLLENEIEREEVQQQDAPPRWHPDTKMFYKREIPAH